MLNIDSLKKKKTETKTTNQTKPTKKPKQLFISRADFI